MIQQSSLHLSQSEKNHLLMFYLACLPLPDSPLDLRPLGSSSHQRNHNAWWLMLFLLYFTDIQPAIHLMLNLLYFTFCDESYNMMGWVRCKYLEIRLILQQLLLFGPLPILLNIYWVLGQMCPVLNDLLWIIIQNNLVMFLTKKLLDPFSPASSILYLAALSRVINNNKYNAGVKWC